MAKAEFVNPQPDVKVFLSNEEAKALRKLLGAISWNQEKDIAALTERECRATEEVWKALKHLWN